MRMKKLLGIILAFLLALGCAACHTVDLVTPDDITGGGGGGGEVTDSARQEYDKKLSEWSESGHLYFHYLRFANAKADYDLYDLWLWQNAPVDQEGKSFDYLKLDVSGAVFDIDLNVPYPDGGKQNNITVDYRGTTKMGFLIVLKSSKGGAGHWKSDGGNIYIENFDTLARSDGSIHIFMSEGATADYTFTFAASVERDDPYEDVTPGSAISHNNVDSSKTNYGMTATAPDFYNEAGVGYQIQVCSFADSNGDGMGDIKGITNNLDYLDEVVHADVLWLTPVQLSESYHGYDITDFYRIDPRFGTLDDYRELMYEAHKRGIRVLMDLVVNHTAKNNVWFDKSLNLVKEEVTVGGVKQEVDYRNFYNWRNADGLPKSEEYLQSWHSYGEGDKEYYYFGRFNDLMPELNYDYQGTRDAIVDVALYWLAFGLDGFRIDAVKHVYMEGEYSTSNTGDEIHTESNGYSRNVTKNVNFFKEFNARVKAAYPDAFIVGENFDGNGDHLAPYYEGIDSQFNFNAYYNIGRDAVGFGTYAGLAEYAANLTKFNAKRSGKAIDSPFSSNHDVSRALNVVMGNGGAVNESQRQTAEKKLKAWESVVLTLPGLSWLYYGDELGMEGYLDNNVAYGDIQLRQPFKWTTAGKAAGGDAQITGFTFDKYEIKWNNYNKLTKGVNEQKDDADSVLSRVSSLAKLKATDPVLIHGSFTQLSAGEVFAFARTLDGTTYRVYHNLSGRDIGGSYAGQIVWSGGGATATNLPAYSSLIVKA